jgi:hypothetical protein
MTQQPASRLTEELQQFVSERDLSPQGGELDLPLRDDVTAAIPDKPRLVPPAGRPNLDPRFLRTLDIVLIVTAAGVALFWAAVLLSR